MEEWLGRFVGWVVIVWFVYQAKEMEMKRVILLMLLLAALIYAASFGMEHYRDCRHGSRTWVC